MPYNYPDNVPDYIKNLPAEAQKLFVAAFNSVFEKTQDEDKARIAGWGAVKTGFEKRDDEWVKKARENSSIWYIGDTIVLSEEGLTGEVQVLRTGTFHHPTYGKFTIKKEDLANMVKNFHESRPKPPTEMVVDWEHMSTAEPPVRAPAAGWVKDLVQRGDKLFALVEWTDEAAGEIKVKKYRFISPEFNLNYVDKESGHKIGPTLLSVALTNRPFLEGMEPVILSEELASMLLTEARTQEVKMAEWDTQYINDLPDKCFAFIKSGGEKDEDGKTVPRNLRYLPYRNAQGGVDLPHLRNALSRLAQTDLSPEEQAKARKVLIAAAQEAGVGEYSELPEVTEIMWKEVKDEMETIAVLRGVLGLSEAADIVEIVKALKAKADTVDSLTTQLTELQGKVTAAEQKAAEAEGKLNLSEVDKVVEAALNSGKITPKMKEWASTYAARDREGFLAFLSTCEKVGPDLSIKGKEGAVTGQLTDLEKAVAAKLGLSEEVVLKYKQGGG